MEIESHSLFALENLFRQGFMYFPMQTKMTANMAADARFDPVDTLSYSSPDLSPKFDYSFVR